MKHTLLMIAVALLLSGCEGSLLHDAFFADDDDPQSSNSSGYSGSSSSFIYLNTPQPQPTYQPPRMGIITSPPAPDSKTGQSTIQTYWY